MTISDHLSGCCCDGWGRYPSRVAAAACLAVLLAAVAPSPSGAVELEELFRQALEANPDISAARAGRRAAQAAIDEAAAGVWAPTVTLDLGDTRDHKSQSIRNSTNIKTKTVDDDVTITAEVTLYDGGEGRAELRSAEFGDSEAEADLEDTRQSIFVDVSTAYADFIFNRNSAIFKRSILDDYRRLQRRLEDMRARNLATVTEVLRATANRADAQVDLDRFLGEVRIARAGLQSLVGELDGDPADYPDLNLPASLGEAIEQALNLHPAVRSAGFAAEGANADIDAAKAGNLPSISLTGSYEYSAFRKELTTLASTQYSQIREAALALAISIPLYNAGRVSASAREAMETYAQQRDLLDAERASAKRSVIEAWQDKDVAELTLSTAAERITQRAEIYEHLTREFEQGRIDLVDLLDAREETLLAQTRFEQARLDLFNAEIAILRSSGGLGIRAINGGR